jgi:aminopeptidase N
VRAPLKLSVISPSESWKVIGNGAETKRAINVKSKNGKDILFSTGFDLMLDADDQKGFVWDFEPSAPCSSYIYALCAGDYMEIQNKREDALTPMRIFVRKSKLEFVNSDLVFRTVTQGIKFYEKLFD